MASDCFLPEACANYTSPQDPHAHVVILLFVVEAFASELVLQPYYCMLDIHDSHQLRQSHCNVRHQDRYLWELDLLRRRWICLAAQRTAVKYFVDFGLADLHQTQTMSEDA